MLQHAQVSSMKRCNYSTLNVYNVMYNTIQFIQIYIRYKTYCIRFIQCIGNIQCTRTCTSKNLNRITLEIVNSNFSLLSLILLLSQIVGVKMQENSTNKNPEGREKCVNAWNRRELNTIYLEDNIKCA